MRPKRTLNDSHEVVTPLKEAEKEVIPPVIENTVLEYTISEPKSYQEEEWILSPLGEIIPDEITPLMVQDAPKSSQDEEKILLADANDSKLSPEEKQHIQDLLRAIRTKIALGSLFDAHGLIVEWLSLDKNHRELNLLLASIFEQEGWYKKAEYVYVDMIALYPKDKEIYSKLWIALSMQTKYEAAFETYKQLLELDLDSPNTILMLAHIAHELKQHEEAYDYAKMYLKQFPHHPEMLWIVTHACIDQKMRSEALEYLIKLRNISPRNSEVIELIEKLRTEETLAQNFQSQ